MNENEKNINSNKQDKILSFYFVALHFAVILLLVIFGFIGYCTLYKPDFESFMPKQKEEMSEAEKKIAFAKLDAEAKVSKEMATFWSAANINAITDKDLKAQVEYGKELIAHTAKYLGPKGSVAQITNGMNCQNCHLDAGTKPWGNNYGAVFATYPKYRARSGKEEDIFKRVSDCMERSLNGKALAKDSKEMLAIKAYIEYIGKDAEKGKKPKASGIIDLPFLKRKLDTEKGKAIYVAKCQSCHQENGEGLLAEDKVEYIYPPLWGKNSYNFGAGLYRMSRFAGYVKYNMPWGVTFDKPQLSDEEAWDVAGFINSQPRPSKDLSQDWPKIGEKPADHPFGPFSDSFSEEQHKYGPFQPIADAKKKEKEAKEKATVQPKP
jgi:thiosulfate dehydrogenase